MCLVGPSECKDIGLFNVICCKIRRGLMVLTALIKDALLHRTSRCLLFYYENKN